LQGVTRSVWILALAFLLWTIGSFISSETRNYGLDEVMHTGSLLLLFLWAASIPRESVFRSSVARTLSVATLLASGIGIAVYVYQPVNRFVGSFFDFRFHTDYWPNAWAEFLLLAWPILVWTLFLTGPSERHRGKDFLKAALFGLVIAALFLSYSRGAVIALGGQILLAAVLILWKKRVHFTKRFLLVPLLAAVVSLAFFVLANAARSSHHHVESVTDKIVFQAAEGTSSVSERREFWEQAVKLTLDRPLLGYGPYSFRFLQPTIQTSVLATSDHPHNVLLKYASERGIPAAIFFCLLIGLCVLSVLRNPTPRWFDLFAVVSIVGVLAHNMIDFNLQFLGIALPMWVLLGCIAPVKTDARASERVLRRWVEGVIACLLLVLTFIEGFGLFLSSRARHALHEGDASASIAWYEGVEWATFSRDDWITRSLLFLGQSDYARAEADAQTYVVLNPHDARGFRLLGDIYRSWGQEDEALRAYEKAFVRSSRNDLGIARGYAELLYSDREKLTAMKPTFDLLLSDFADAILVNAHFIALSKNVEELEALTHILSRAFPENRGIYASIRKRVLEHAEEERRTYTARPGGLLW